METRGCCKTIMMGYVCINPKLYLCAWMLDTLMLDCGYTLNYVCALGCWEEPSLSLGVLKNSVPYMTEIVPTNVLVLSRIVNPYVDGFLDGPGQVLVLPAYDVKTGFVVLCSLPVVCVHW